MIRNINDNYKFYPLIVFYALLGFLIYIGINPIILWGVFAISVCIFLVARFPSFTISMTIVFGQLLGVEAQNMLPPALRQPNLGSVELRYFDIWLLSIVLVLLIRFILNIGETRSRSLSSIYAILILITYFLFRTVFSARDYGIVSAVGEFRTYYQYIFLTLYIHSMCITYNKLERTLKFSLLALVIFSILRSFLEDGLSIGAGIRWISAAGNLSCVFILILLGIGSYSRNQLYMFRFYIFLVAVMTILNNHRSVWLACSVALLLSFFYSRLKIKQVTRFLAIVIFILPIINLTPIQYASGVSDYFSERTKAFTDYQDDNTANWRYDLWRKSIQKTEASPVVGLGLGENFQLIDLAGELVTTYPHNYYVTIYYHFGLLGLFLFMLCFIHIAYSIYKNRKMKISKATAIITIMSLSFFTAYSTEYIFWIALGIFYSEIEVRPNLNTSGVSAVD